MVCPKCGSGNVYVIDTRQEANNTQRRKKCAECNERWSTIEVFAGEYCKLVSLRDAVCNFRKATEEADG